MKHHPSGAQAKGSPHPPKPKAKPSPRKPEATVFCTNSSPAKGRGKAARTSVKRLRQAPGATPVLFVQGLAGGSLKTDLGGVGVNLSSAAFAYSIPDESLSGLEIHRGDIALVDPAPKLLEEGNLVLLGVCGTSVVRRLTKKQGLWNYAAADGCAASEPTLLLGHPLEGVVLGFIRLFSRAKAVSYHGPAAKSGTSREAVTPRSEAVLARKALPAAVPSNVRYSKRKRHAVVLTGEECAPKRLSEL